jgi:hypothetical protein
MPLVYPSHEIKPTRIAQCKRTYIIASGRAEGRGATDGAAVNAALAGAAAEIALAVADARALRCAPAAGCDGTCQQGRLLRVGKGIDRNVPVKKAGVWVARAWGFESFELYCHCP